MIVAFVLVIQQLSDEPVPPELSKVSWQHVNELAWPVSFCICTIQTSKQMLSIYMPVIHSEWVWWRTPVLAPYNSSNKSNNFTLLKLLFATVFSCFSMIVYFVNVFVWCNPFMKGSRSIPSSGFYILHTSIYIYIFNCKFLLSLLLIPVWDYEMSPYLSTTVRCDI